MLKSGILRKNSRSGGAGWTGKKNGKWIGLVCESCAGTPPRSQRKLAKETQRSVTWVKKWRNLNDNRSHPSSGGLGAVREGAALLQGIVLCGRCGRRMTTRYTV